MSLHPAIVATRQVVCRSCDCGADPADPCAACGKGKWFPRRECDDTAPPPARSMPSLPSMAATAAAAAVAETKAILQGLPPVTMDEIQRRMKVCSSPCENYIAEANRCRLCGCFLRFKTALRTGACPAGKW